MPTRLKDPLAEHSPSPPYAIQTNDADQTRAGEGLGSRPGRRRPHHAVHWTRRQLETTLTQGIGAWAWASWPRRLPTFIVARVHPNLGGGPDLTSMRTPTASRPQTTWGLAWLLLDRPSPSSNGATIDRSHGEDASPSSARASGGRNAAWRGRHRPGTDDGRRRIVLRAHGHRWGRRPRGDIVTARRNISTRTARGRQVHGRRVGSHRARDGPGHPSSHRRRDH